MGKLVKEVVITQESAHHLGLAIDSELDSVFRSAHAVVTTQDENEQKEKEQEGDNVEKT